MHTPVAAWCRELPKCKIPVCLCRGWAAHVLVAPLCPTCRVAAALQPHEAHSKGRQLACKQGSTEQGTELTVAYGAGGQRAALGRSTPRCASLPQAWGTGILFSVGTTPV